MKDNIQPIRLEVFQLRAKRASLHEEYVELFNDVRNSLLRLVAAKSQYELMCKLSNKEPNPEYDKFVELMVHKYLLKGSDQ